MWPRVDAIYFAGINLGRRWTSPWKLFNFTRFSNLFWALRDSGLVISPTPRCREIYWFYEREKKEPFSVATYEGGTRLARSTCETLNTRLVRDREPAGESIRQEKCYPNCSGSRTSRRPRDGEGRGGEGGRETNKSTIGIYACISDERAGDAGAKRVVWKGTNG